jgi:predicted O-methyltransferase YrrM
MALATGRTIVSQDRRINLFLIMKFFLKNIAQGDIIEFGAYKGGNAIFMAAVAKKLYPGTKIYALDTFEGMPQTDKNIDSHNKGDFADVSFPELQGYIKSIGLDNLVLVKGLFEHTATDTLKKANNVILAHIDCDIYSAVCFSYDVVKPAMANGGYIVFDDATEATCLGATEAVEDLAYGRDRLHAEQIFPHFVFRAFSD